MNGPTLHSPDTVHLRITMPEFPDVQMVMPFSPEDTVWSVKQKFLHNLKKDLADGQNYGLYVPPASCRAGKFLEEERCLREYPLAGGIKYFEFKYKNRVKFSFEVSSMKLKKINTPANQKEFLEWVRRDDNDKTSKLLNKGFNPNYNHILSGETPLTLATKLTRPRGMLINLVSGGAFIDYRNKKGNTPLHVAVENKNKDAMRTLLDLGSSPNYKNSENLTPLYVCCMNECPLQLTSMLLHERAQLQCRDRNGFTELHHACKQGKMELVEQLVFYGADLNSQDHNGDTPLHICAALNHDSSAKVLLMRGADKTICNNKGQTAAKICQDKSNMFLYKLMEDFKSSDIMFFTDLPVYNEKRRGLLSAATIRSLEKSRSNPNLHLLFANQLNPTSTISAASLNTIPNHSNRTSVTDNINNNNSLTNKYMSDYVANKDINNYNNGFTSNQLNARVRHSAIEMDWNADKKDTTPRAAPAHSLDYFEEQSIIIRKGAGKGFGFAIKNVDAMSDETPCRQVFNEVYEGKSAATAGLMAGDYLLEINGRNVRDISHEDCVRMLKQVESVVRLKVLRKKPKSQAATEDDFIFKNPLHTNNSGVFKSKPGETDTDLNISTSQNRENQLKIENRKTLTLDGVDATLTSEPALSTPKTHAPMPPTLKSLAPLPPIAVSLVSPITTSAPVIQETSQGPSLTEKELQASIPKPPPIPEFGTLKPNRPPESPSMTEAFNSNRSSQLNTTKPKEAGNNALNDAAHNDLLDAIKRRKKLVDDVGSDVLSASIENKVNQSRKINSLGKSNIIEQNKDKFKNNSFVPPSPSNRQNYGLLASGETSKTLGKPVKYPTSTPSDSSDFLTVYTTTAANTESNYSPTLQAKTLPKKGASELLKEYNSDKGFLADAEMLRLMFLEKKFNSTSNLKMANADENNNVSIKSSKEDEKEVPSVVVEETKVETSRATPVLQNKELISILPVSNGPATTVNNKHSEQQQRLNLLEEIKEKKQNFNFSEDSVENKIKEQKSKLTLDTGLVNGTTKNSSPIPSPSIAALANIVAEMAQQKQDSIQKVQEPSAGTTKIYSGGNTLSKNKSPPNTASPKVATQKPLNVLYTSQNHSKPPTPTVSSTNKRLYTSAPKSEVPSSIETSVASFEMKNAQKSQPVKFKLQSANPRAVSHKLENLPTSPSNNISALSKTFTNGQETLPPATSPKSFLQNNKTNNSNNNNSKYNDKKIVFQNYQYSNISSSLNGDTKEPKKSVYPFVKSPSADTTHSTVTPSDLRNLQISPQASSAKVFVPTSPKITTPPEPAFPTLRRTPQQTNTLVFKAKPHSTPNSPPKTTY